VAIAPPSRIPRARGEFRAELRFAAEAPSPTVWGRPYPRMPRVKVFVLIVKFFGSERPATNRIVPVAISMTASCGPIRIYDKALEHDR
jgi:hypothetical protein